MSEFDMERAADNARLHGRLLSPHEQECFEIGWHARDAEVKALKEENDLLRRERDAYKKAKEENDFRFMTERDDARMENAALRDILKNKQKIIAVMAHDLLMLGVNFDFDKALDRHAHLVLKELEAT